MKFLLALTSSGNRPISACVLRLAHARACSRRLLPQRIGTQRAVVDLQQIGRGGAARQRRPHSTASSQATLHAFEPVSTDGRLGSISRVQASMPPDRLATCSKPAQQKLPRRGGCGCRPCTSRRSRPRDRVPPALRQFVHRDVERCRASWRWRTSQGSRTSSTRSGSPRIEPALEFQRCNFRRRPCC